MSLEHTLQWKFGNVPYPSSTHPKATVATGGCGPCSALMMVECMTEQRFKMKDWIAWVLSTGARVSGGTSMSTLSKAMVKQFGFAVTTTSDENILKAHLQKGGMAIGNCAGGYGSWKGLFSTEGHFFAIVGFTKDDYYTVLDPNWTSSKFTNQKNSLSKWRSQRVKVGQGGILYVNAANLNADTKGRTPSYWLFSLAKQNDSKTEEETSVSAIYNKVEDCPTWSQALVQRMKDDGIIQGDTNGDLQLDLGDIKALTWLERYTQKKDPVFVKLEDVPSWGKEIASALVKEGVLRGDGKGNLNIKEDTLKTLVFLQRKGLLK